jgi:hypothetical protein
LQLVSSVQQLALVQAVQVVSRIAVGQRCSPVVPLSVLVACGVMPVVLSPSLVLVLPPAVVLDSSADVSLDVAPVPDVSAG